MNERLEKLIEALGVTKIAFSQRIGVSKQAVGLVLNGSNKPGYNFILGILKSFPEVNIRWLYLGEGEMFSNESNKNFFNSPVALGVSNNVQGTGNEQNITSYKSQKNHDSSDVIEALKLKKENEELETAIEDIKKERDGLQREINLLYELLKSKDQNIELLLKK